MAKTNLDSLVFLGVRGNVVALDRRTGAEQWRTPLKGDFVNVVLDGDVLFATARGEIFCLDPITGRMRWTNPLKGLGWGLITIANSSIAPIAQQRMNEQEAAAVAASATSSK